MFWNIGIWQTKVLALARPGAKWIRAPSNNSAEIERKMKITNIFGNET